MFIFHRQWLNLLLFLAGAAIFLNCKYIFELLVYLLGPEIFVGKENVIYASDGCFYTNPGAMVLWTGGIALSGVILLLKGLWMFLGERSRRKTTP